MAVLPSSTDLLNKINVDVINDLLKRKFDAKYFSIIELPLNNLIFYSAKLNLPFHSSTFIFTIGDVFFVQQKNLYKSYSNFFQLNLLCADDFFFTHDLRARGNKSTALRSPTVKFGDEANKIGDDPRTSETDTIYKCRN